MLCLNFVGVNYTASRPPNLLRLPTLCPEASLNCEDNKDLSIAYMVLTLAFQNTVVASLDVMPSWDNAFSNGFACPPQL